MGSAEAPGARGTAPAFHDRKRVGDLYAPDTSAAVLAGRGMGMDPSETDEERILLLLVDPQVDFIHEDGTLAVPGAVDDTRRTIDWIFAHGHRITDIAVSLDSHVPNQIFYPSWWSGSDGEPPAPFTPITAEDVQRGRWAPRFQPEWSRSYVERLESEARKQLMIWPFHTMLGTPGHAVTPALYEAVCWHAAGRNSQPRFVIKGDLPETEFYSIFEPEVEVPHEPRGVLNGAFLDWVLEHDRVFVAGQAKSHCVLETITSIARRYDDRPDVLERCHVLTDCMSSVAHPDIDFETVATETLNDYARKGMKLIGSGDPV